MAGSEGGSDASGSAQNNALGNLGTGAFEVNYKGDRYTLTILPDILSRMVRERISVRFPDRDLCLLLRGGESVGMVYGCDLRVPLYQIPVGTVSRPSGNSRGDGKARS